MECIEDILVKAYLTLLFSISQALSLSFRLNPKVFSFYDVEYILTINQVLNVTARVTISLIGDSVCACLYNQHRDLLCTLSGWNNPKGRRRERKTLRLD